MQFLRRMCPIQFAFRLRISCRIFLCSSNRSTLQWKIKRQYDWTCNNNFCLWGFELCESWSECGSLFLRYPGFEFRHLPMQVRPVGRRLLQFVYCIFIWKHMPVLNIFSLRRLLQLAYRYRNTLWSVCIVTMSTFLCRFVYLIWRHFRWLVLVCWKMQSVLL
jgi:hypothetical protein